MESNWRVGFYFLSRTMQKSHTVRFSKGHSPFFNSSLSFLEILLELLHKALAQSTDSIKTEVICRAQDADVFYLAVNMPLPRNYAKFIR